MLCAISPSTQCFQTLSDVDASAAGKMVSKVGPLKIELTPAYRMTFITDKAGDEILPAHIVSI